MIISHKSHIVKMELSFIIPVYNVGALLDKCLYSLYNNGLADDDFEAIVIDDASPSYDVESIIANKYAQIHKNLVFLRHDKNKGLSASRNTGLQCAGGKYVWFVDSDDAINAEYVYELLKKAISSSLDVLCFGFRMIEEDTGKCTDCVLEGYPDKEWTGQEFLINVPIHVMAWSALYRRQFLLDNNLCFLDGVLHEDQEFTPRVYCMAGHISYVPVPGYNYLQRHGSIMKSVNPKKIRDLITICNRLWNFAIKNTEDNSDIRYFFINRISFLYAQCLRNMAICGYENYPNLPFYPLSINSFLNNREKLQYSLININVRFYVFIKSMMFKLRISNRTSH